MKFYYDTPSHSVALNAKVASSSIAKAIVHQFYPIGLKIVTIKKDKQYHYLCPGSHIPDKPIVLLIRDPLERFLSACSELKITQEEVGLAIDSLINDTLFINKKPADITQETWEQAQKFLSQSFDQRVEYLQKLNLPIPRKNYLRDDVHFYHQHSYIIKNATCFRFPRDIDALANFLHLSNGIECLNENNGLKLQLTNQQKIDIQSYYFKDQQLFENITEPGLIFSNESS